MDINQATQAFNAEVEKELTAWQNETIFNKEMLPENFHELVNEVFAFNSPFQLKMSIDFYKQIVEERDNEYTLMEISCICHVIKIRNADELGMTMSEYVKLQEDIEVIAKEYLTIVSGKQESIQRKLQATMRVEQSVPEHKKTIKLTPMAEA